MIESRTTLLTVLLIAGTLLTSCGSAPRIDDALTGTWTQLDGSIRVTYTFGADGSFNFSVGSLADEASGTYSAVNGVVTANVVGVLGVDRERWTFSYYVNATQFGWVALHPSGSHSGLIGTWTGVRKIELLNHGPMAPDGETIRAEFREDGSYEWSETPFYEAPPTHDVGTWTMAADGTIVRTRSAYPLRLLDDAALVRATDVFQRK